MFDVPAGTSTFRARSSVSLAALGAPKGAPYDYAEHTPRGCVGIVPHGQRERALLRVFVHGAVGVDDADVRRAARRRRPMSRRGRLAPTCHRAGGR